MGAASTGSSEPVSPPGPETRSAADAAVRAWVDAHQETERRRGAGGVAYDTPWAVADALAASFPGLERLPVWWGDPCAGVGRLLVATWQCVAAEPRWRSALPEFRRRMRGFDIDTDALSVARGAMARAVAATVTELRAAGLVEDAEELAAADAEAGGFEVGDAASLLARERAEGREGGQAWIITNPPFESIRSMHRRLGRDAVCEIRRQHPVCVGAFDSGVPIFGRCLEATEQGALCAVIPASWTEVAYASRLRDAMSARTWRRVFADGHHFEAAVRTMAISDSAVLGDEVYFDGREARIPESCVALSTIAAVHGGTPGFDAAEVTSHLAGGGEEGWPFITTASIEPWSLSLGDIRFARRVWSRPRLSFAVPLSEARRRVYGAAKVVVPGVFRRLTAAIDDVGCALGVGVYAICADELNEYVAACLNSSRLRDWYARAHGGAALSGGYQRITATALRTLPVPDPGRSDVRAAIEQLRGLEGDRKAHASLIDDIVSELYP